MMKENQEFFKRGGRYRFCIVPRNDNTVPRERKKATDTLFLRQNQSRYRFLASVSCLSSSLSLSCRYTNRGPRLFVTVEYHSKYLEWQRSPTHTPLRAHTTDTQEKVPFERSSKEFVRSCSGMWRGALFRFYLAKQVGYPKTSRRRYPSSRFLALSPCMCVLST
jgi:hypothetical protein